MENETKVVKTSEKLPPLDIHYIGNGTLSVKLIHGYGDTKYSTWVDKGENKNSDSVFTLLDVQVKEHETSGKEMLFKLSSMPLKRYWKEEPEPIIPGEYFWKMVVENGTSWTMSDMAMVKFSLTAADIEAIMAEKRGEKPDWSSVSPAPIPTPMPTVPAVEQTVVVVVNTPKNETAEDQPRQDQSEDKALAEIQKIAGQVEILISEFRDCSRRQTGQSWDSTQAISRQMLILGQLSLLLHDMRKEFRGNATIGRKIMKMIVELSGMRPQVQDNSALAKSITEVASKNLTAAGKNEFAAAQFAENADAIMASVGQIVEQITQMVAGFKSELEHALEAVSRKKLGENSDRGLFLQAILDSKQVLGEANKLMTTVKVALDRQTAAMAKQSNMGRKLDKVRRGYLTLKKEFKMLWSLVWNTRGSLRKAWRHIRAMHKAFKAERAATAKVVHEIKASHAALASAVGNIGIESARRYRELDRANMALAWDQREIHGMVREVLTEMKKKPEPVVVVHPAAPLLPPIPAIPENAHAGGSGKGFYVMSYVLAGMAIIGLVLVVAFQRNDYRSLDAVSTAMAAATISADNMHQQSEAAVDKINLDKALAAMSKNDSVVGR